MGSWIENRHCRTVALLCALSPLPALGGEAEQRQAQSLFDQARKLLEAGDAAKACPLFAESQRLDPGGGTLLNLAVCHEKQGRFATAYAEYQEALSISIRDGRSDRENVARARAKALEPRLPRLQVKLAHDVAGVVFELDGAKLTQLVRETPTAVDPGKHKLVVSAPGHRKYVTVVEAVEAKLSVVKVPALEPIDAAPPSAPASAPAKPAAAPPMPTCGAGTRLKGSQCVPVAKESRLSTASYAVGGTGLVLLGVSAVTGILALSADSDAKQAAEDACVPSRGFCPNAPLAQQAQDDADRARTMAWVSTGALVLGAAALTTAWLLPRTEVTAEVGFTPGGATLGASHRF